MNPMKRETLGIALPMSGKRLTVLTRMRKGLSERHPAAGNQLFQENPADPGPQDAGETVPDPLNVLTVLTIR